MNASQSSRLPAFDNLRYLMVLLVLVFHSAASYGSAVDFWPFHESDSSVLFDLFMFLCDTFMMAVLFFIAGYFALPSSEKKGGKSFVVGKFKRLGLPWLVVTVLVLPVLDYIHYINQSAGKVASTLSYASYWLASMMKILEFRVGWMDMSAYWYMTDHYYQRYLWFLTLLLLFFIIFAAVRSGYLKLFGGIEQRSNGVISKPQSIYKILAVVGIINIVLFGLVRFLAYPEFLASGWFSLGNIIQFQAGKLTIYACYFVMGIIAYKRQWFSGSGRFGRIWVWGIICFCLFGLNMMVLKNLNSIPNPTLILKLGFIVLYPAWTLSFLGFFVSLAINHWNRTNAFHQSMARHSYDMYLVHYVIPFTLPLLLSGWTVPIGIKFLVTVMVTLVFSYSFSRFLLKNFPKSVVLFLVGVTVLLFIIPLQK